ncbi:MAG: hypothetical protein ACRC0G_07645 [Fusobacteriaceae bacterium]
MAKYNKDFDAANIKEYMIENIAKKYISLSNQSNYRVGIFGHINEIMADAIEDAAVSVKTLYPEIFPNKARLPESIYAYAALAKYTNFNAYPAEASFYLAIYEEDIMAKLDRKTGSAMYTISNDIVFYVDDMAFMLDYPIVLTLFNETNKDERIFNAVYDMSINNPLSSLESPYINLLKMDMGNPQDPQKVILLGVELKQLIKSSVEKSILSNEVVENTSIRFDFDGDLANFEVYYSKEGSDVYEYLEKYLEDSAVFTTNKYCYYKFLTENMIEVIFPYGMNFRPELGSDIKVNFFTTLGTLGNRNKYTGLNMKNVYPTDDAGDNLEIIVYPLSDSENGSDKVTMEAASLKISEEFSARGSINNERDLQNYFNNLQDQNYITFMKSRDDCMYRRFSAFMLMRDQANSIIGTNTLNIKLTDGDFISEGDILTVPSRVALEYAPLDMPVSPHIELSARELLITKDISGVEASKVIEFENKEFLYGNPFLMSINKSPLSVAFYINHINRNYRMTYSYINKRSPLQMMIDDFSIKRDTFTDYTKYKINLDLKPTAYDTELGICEVGDDGSIVDLDRIRVYVVYKDSVGVALGYSKLMLTSYDKDTKTYHFNQELETNDELNSDNRLNIVKGIMKPNTIIEDNTFLPVNDMNVTIYVADRNTNLSDVNIESIVPDISQFKVSNGYSNKKDVPVELMVNLNDIMRSSVTVDTVGGKNVFYVRAVPLFRYSYINDIAKLEYVLNIIEMKRLFLKQAVSKLTNSFYIDFKSYNTYGRSKYYKIGYSGKDLNKINVTLNFRLKLKTGSSESLSSQIKNFMTETIETMNTGYGLNFYISNLTSELTRNFPEIIWIEFININNYPTTDQIIEAIPQNDIYELSFVPEYISVGTDLNSIGEYIGNINLSLV